jgi:hypothetical protein
VSFAIAVVHGAEQRASATRPPITCFFIRFSDPPAGAGLLPRLTPQRDARGPHKNPAKKSESYHQLWSATKKCQPMRPAAAQTVRRAVQARPICQQIGRNFSRLCVGVHPKK